MRMLVAAGVAAGGGQLRERGPRGAAAAAAGGGEMAARSRALEMILQPQTSSRSRTRRSVYSVSSVVGVGELGAGGKAMSQDQAARAIQGGFRAKKM